MDKRTTPPLQGHNLLTTQLELVCPTTVAGVFYGIALTLFSLYVHALAPRFRNGDRKRQAIFMLAYSTVIMACGLYYLVSNAWVTQDAYIKHSDYPRGPYGYILSTFLTSPVIPIGLTCQMLIEVLTLAIQIWRVWVIWRATRYAVLVTMVPALCFLSFTGLKLRTLILSITLSNAEIVPVDRVPEQVKTAIQGTTTVLCTLLISLYLIFKQWRQRKLIGKNQGASIGYANIVAMIVESYAVESVWQLTFVIIWHQAASSFFEETLPYIEMIAYLLLQYRVARGKAYDSEPQREPRNMSSLRWNHSNHATGTTQSEEIGGVRNSPHVPAMPADSNTARVTSMA